MMPRSFHGPASGEREAGFTFADEREAGCTLGAAGSDATQLGTGGTA
jgi:hypothetical protein